MVPKKPVTGLDPVMDTGFRKRSCSAKMLGRRSIQYEAIGAVAPSTPAKSAPLPTSLAQRVGLDVCVGRIRGETIGGKLATGDCLRNQKETGLETRGPEVHDVHKVS